MASEYSASLTWSRIARKRPQEFALTSGSKSLARLIWQKSSGSLAMGDSPDGSWTFKRTGFLSTRITIRESGAEIDLGTFYPSFGGGGRLEMTDGRFWQFRARGFLSSRYELYDASSRLVLTLRLKGFGSGGELQFEAPAPDNRTASLLAMLVWYVSQLAKADAEAAAVIACCS